MTWDFSEDTCPQDQADRDDRSRQSSWEERAAVGTRVSTLENLQRERFLLPYAVRDIAFQAQRMIGEDPELMSYVRVSLSGTLPGGESWSVSPNYNETTNNPGWDQSEGQDAADAVAALIPPAALLTLMSSACSLDIVRVERRTDAGVLLGAAEAAPPAAINGTTNATKPYQTSLVLSLRTTLPGGRGRGRLYWPALGASIATTTLRLSNPTIEDAASAGASYLDSIETALKNAFYPVPSLIDFSLCVVSRAGGFRTDVNAIDVGDVLDVQRRRRDKVAEGRVLSAYPPL